MYIPSTMTAHRWLILALLFLLAVTSHGLPYLLISNNRPKCVTVSASRQITLKIKYHVPGKCNAMYCMHACIHNLVACIYMYIYICMHT
jgi:hypothetical protein